MNETQVTSAQYLAEDGENHTIKATIDGQELFVPLDLANRHYSAILKAVEAGDLIIAEADQT